MTRRYLLRGGALALALAMVLASPAAALDSDKDGLSDAFETKYGVTSPHDWDSDDDGVIDAAEDLDRDKLGNLGEQKYGTHPTKRDTDGDGIVDGLEDDDGDKRSNAREQDQRPVPANMRPDLRLADKDKYPGPSRCRAGAGVSRLKVCLLGDRESRTELVVWGDSNATMYLTAFDRIGKARGWKIKSMTKAACPVFLGMRGSHQHDLDGNATCGAWRRNAVARLAANPPDYLVISLTNYRLRTPAGGYVPVRERPVIWRSSVKRTLKRLPPQTKVLVLGRVPRLNVDPESCLLRHPKDMSKCVTKAIPLSRRPVDLAIRAGAREAGAEFGSLYGQICPYDPCPVVQGNVLIQRDGNHGHLTETFARRMQPSIAKLIDVKLLGK